LRAALTWLKVGGQGRETGLRLSRGVVVGFWMVLRASVGRRQWYAATLATAEGERTKRERKALMGGAELASIQGLRAGIILQ